MDRVAELSFILLLFTMVLWLHPPKVSPRWRTAFQLSSALIGMAAIALSLYLAYRAHN